MLLKIFFNNYALKIFSNNYAFKNIFHLMVLFCKGLILVEYILSIVNKLIILDFYNTISLSNI